MRGLILVVCFGVAASAVAQTSQQACKDGVRAAHQECLDNCPLLVDGFDLAEIYKTVPLLIPIIREAMIRSCERTCDETEQEKLNECRAKRPAESPQEPD